MKKLVSEGMSMHSTRNALVLASALLATGMSTQADTFNWIGTLNSTSLWHTAAIWANASGGATTVPNLSGDVASIQSGYGSQWLNLSSNATVGRLVSGTAHNGSYTWGAWILNSTTAGTKLRFANGGQTAEIAPAQGAARLDIGNAPTTALAVELLDPLRIVKTAAYSSGVNFNAPIQGGSAASPKPITVRCSSDQYTTLTVSLLNSANSFVGDVVVDADARPGKTVLRLGKVGLLNGSDAMLGNLANALILRNGAVAIASAINSSASYTLGRALRGTGRFAVRGEDQWGGALVRRTLNVATNGLLSPGEGAALGTLTLYGNVVLGSAATTRVKLTPTASDTFVFDATTLTLGGTLELMPATPGLTWPVGTSWTIATTPTGTTSSVSGTFASVSSGFSVATTGSQAGGYSIVVTAVPETFTTLHWDADGSASTAVGGSGTWDTSASLWRNGSSTGPLQAWSAGGRAVLGGTAGTVTLNSSSQDIAFNRISLTKSGYTVAAPSNGTARLTLGGTSPTIDVSSYCSATINAVLAGSTLTKAGSGMVAIRGANTYSGGTSHTAGGLTIGHVNALGTGALYLNGGNLSAYTGLSGEVPNPVVVNSNFTFSNNSFPGYGTSLGLSGPVTLTGSRQIFVNITGIMLNGVVSDGGNGYGLTYASGSYANFLTLGGANTFSGGLTYNANANSTLNLGNFGALGTGTFTINGSGGKINNTTGADGILSDDIAQVWNGNFTFVGTRSLHLGYGPVSLGTAAGAARTVTVTANTLIVGGAISNGATADSLTKAGAGTLALAGVNTYDGGTLVSAGVLSVEAIGGLGTGTVTVAPGALLFVPQDGAIADDATVTLQRSGSTYGRVQIPAPVVEYVGAVVLDGASCSQPGTSFGAVGTGSTVESDAYFLGGGQLVVTPAGGAPNSPYVPAGYENVFRDEFNESRLRLDNWWTRYIYNNGMQDTLNDERQLFRENDNHIMTGNTLELTGYVVPTADPRFQYESGMIRSKDTFKYGYFESRAKMPPGIGSWPGFWLNSDSRPDGSLSWPPEIDILEFVNNGIDDRPNMLHIGVANAGSPSPYGITNLYLHPNCNTAGHYTAPFNFPDAYHVFGLLWDTDDTASFYVDGVLIAKKHYNWVYTSGAEAAYAHVLLNYAIGGSWAGRYGIDDTAFPQAMEVDYVRVYQKPDHILMGRSTIGRDLLIYPDEVVVDNSAGTGVQITGAWTTSTVTGGYWGPNYIQDGNTGKGSKSVRFTPTLQAGDYQVSIRHTAGSNRASNVPVDIVHADGTDYVTVNQRYDNAQWITLGIFRFTAGTAGSVLVGNSGTDGYVIADAVRFTPVEPEGYAAPASAPSSPILIY
jgi:autotransporter-associated beta strand protein